MTLVVGLLHGATFLSVTGKNDIGKKRSGKKRICIYAHGEKAHSERSAYGKNCTRKKRTCTRKYNTKNSIYIVVE